MSQYQVQIKINGVVSTVSVDANSRKEAASKAKKAHPSCKFLMAYIGNPPIIKHPIGKPPEEILSKFSRKKNETVGVSVSIE